MKEERIDKVPVGIGLVFIALLFYFSSKYQSCTQKEIIENKDSIVCKEDSFTVKDFVLELHIQGVKYPDIVLRQACWESGFFTSAVWKKKNNPFGFYCKDGYIMFNDWKSAIAYMKTWQDKNYKSGSYYDYLLKIGYASDTSYIDHVKSIDLSNLRGM